MTEKKPNQKRGPGAGSVILTGSETDWDTYVRNHPLSSHCHLHGWRRVMENTYGHNTHYLTLLEQETSQVRGILPLVRLNRPLGGNRLISLPYLDSGGILADSPRFENALLREAIRLGKRLGSDYVEFRQVRPLESIPIKQGACFMEELNCNCQVSSRKVSNFLSLPACPQKLMDSFKSKLRSQVKKAIRNGCHAHIGGMDLIGPFYEVFARNMRDLGSPVHPRRLFENVLRQFPEDAEIAMVYRKGKGVAGSLMLTYRNTLHNPWASSLREFRPQNPNMMLYWTMLEHACKKGLTRFDFGRSSPGSGPHRFKLQWGAVSSPLFWNYLSLKKKRVDPERERLNFGLWKRLPVPLSKCLGPAIRKHVSL